MKKTLLKLIFTISTLFYSNVYSQDCWFSHLLKIIDEAPANTELKTFFNNASKNDFDAYKIIYANKPKVKNDPIESVKALSKVLELPQDVKTQLGVNNQVLGLLEGSREGSYASLLNKIKSIGKKLEDYPNTELENFYDKVLYKLEKNSTATTNQRIGAEGVLKTVDGTGDEFARYVDGIL